MANPIRRLYGALAAAGFLTLAGQAAAQTVVPDEAIATAPVEVNNVPAADPVMEVLTSQIIDFEKTVPVLHIPAPAVLPAVIVAAVEQTKEVAPEIIIAAQEAPPIIANVEAVNLQIDVGALSDTIAPVADVSLVTIMRGGEERYQLRDKTTGRFVSNSAVTAERFAEMARAVTQAKKPANTSPYNAVNERVRAVTDGKHFRANRDAAPTPAKPRVTYILAAMPASAFDNLVFTNNAQPQPQQLVAEKKKKPSFLSPLNIGIASLTGLAIAGAVLLSGAGIKRHSRKQMALQVTAAYEEHSQAPQQILDAKTFAALQRVSGDQALEALHHCYDTDEITAAFHKAGRELQLNREAAFQELLLNEQHYFEPAEKSAQAVALGMTRGSYNGHTIQVPSEETIARMMQPDPIDSTPIEAPAIATATVTETPAPIEAISFRRSADAADVPEIPSALHAGARPVVHTTRRQNPDGVSLH